MMNKESSKTVGKEQYNWAPWVYLDLEWGKATRFWRDVLLTINFGKHHLKIAGGTIWFCLRGGELKLEPQSGKFPYEHFWPENPLRVEVKIKRSMGSSTTSKQSRTSGVSAKASPPEADLSHDSTVERERQSDVKDEFEHVCWRVHSKGSEDSAFWEFEAIDGERCLEGRLTRQKIARLSGCEKPCVVLATLRVFKKDIRLLYGEGIWPEDLSATKLAVLRAFLRKSVANKMGPIVYSYDLRLADSK